MHKCYAKKTLTYEMAARLSRRPRPVRMSLAQNNVSLCSMKAQISRRLAAWTCAAPGHRNLSAQGVHGPVRGGNAGARQFDQERPFATGRAISPLARDRAWRRFTAFRGERAGGWNRRGRKHRGARRRVRGGCSSHAEERLRVIDSGSRRSDPTKCPLAHAVQKARTKWRVDRRTPVAIHDEVAKQIPGAMLRVIEHPGHFMPIGRSHRSAETWLESA
jgi:hypothetical protein